MSTKYEGSRHIEYMEIHQDPEETRQAVQTAVAIFRSMMKLDVPNANATDRH